MKKDEYDAIIIGAGIGGLVCGCYLAKSGLKTLIIEQHSVAGGYCTSFTRQGYQFDSSIHYIGGVKRGSLSEILNELEAEGDLDFVQMDPADKIIMPESTTYIRANPHNTIQEFKKNWPKESGNIENFFKFSMQPSIPTIYKNTANLSFEKILNSFFKNKQLKAAIELLFFANMGLPSSKLSAFASIIFFREFLLDPGYYPKGGMQQFANYLLSKFNFYGGQIILSQKVSKIILKNHKIDSVIVSSQQEFNSKYLVACIDTTQLFKNLLESSTPESKTIDRLIPSNSIFAAYLGMSEGFTLRVNETCNIWYSSTIDFDKCYKSLSSNIQNKRIPFMLISFPSHKASTSLNTHKFSIQFFTPSTFETKEFWNKNRNLIFNEMLDLAKKIIPGIEESIKIKVTATPLTFQRYTLNREGATFGWASTIEQTKTSLLPQETSIKNLFLAGHWCITGAGQGGISTVALSGKKAALRIIKLLGNK